ncbi:MAG: enoyl-CoA hydratase/carnithine racemase [Alphaproteobacteria bacterium]
MQNGDVSLYDCRVRIVAFSRAVLKCPDIFKRNFIQGEMHMPVLYEKKDHIGVLTLSRPAARNAWGPDFYEGLDEYLAVMEADDDIHCMILTGDEAGGAFSAGANLKDPNTHKSESTAQFLKDLPRFRNFPFTALQEFSKPVIGAVNGYAIGIGCIITFSCDLIVASERAEWRLPQVALGIIPAYGGSARLARWVGKGMAMRMAMGFPMSGEEAYRTGLAQWLTPHAEMMDEALRVAQHIADMPPLAARMVKESLLRGMDIPNIEDASLADAYRFMALEFTEDAAEAHQSWRERRPPVFKGK